MTPPSYRYVLYFSFYDGLEDGLAVEDGGSAARIWCLGDASWTGSDDAEHDLHRAFLFERIGGDWSGRVKACAAGARESRHGQLLWPAVEDGFQILKHESDAAVATSFFVAIAHAYLEQMHCVEVDAATAMKWRTATADPYLEVRDFVRRHAP